MALSAHACAELLGDQRIVRQRIYREAHAATAKALELTPKNSRAHSIAGEICYFDTDVPTTDALPHYDRALTLDGGNGWARLYRAHCLHDLERWTEAASAYDMVPPAFLTGRKAWRYEHLLEQRACCRLMAGDHDAAREEFLALVSRWEANPHLASEAWWADLVEAAKGPLRSVLHSRTEALLHEHAPYLVPRLNGTECTSPPGG